MAKIQKIKYEKMAKVFNFASILKKIENKGEKMDSNKIISITSVIIAFIALGISIYEIRESNKQSLFDRRLNAVLKIKWMKSLCDANMQYYKSNFSDTSEPLLLVDVLFLQMTNIAFLEEIRNLPFHLDEDEMKRKYLLKMEEFKNLCEEVIYIFPSDLGHSLSDFIFYYEEMIVCMYRYMSHIFDLKRFCEQNNKEFPNNDFNEEKLRKEMARYISGTFELSERLFSEGTLRKAESKIRL